MDFDHESFATFVGLHTHSLLGRALDVKGANWLITPCSGVRPIDLLANGRLSDFECLAGFSEGEIKCCCGDRDICPGGIYEYSVCRDRCFEDLPGDTEFIERVQDAADKFIDSGVALVKAVEVAHENGVDVNRLQFFSGMSVDAIRQIVSNIYSICLHMLIVAESITRGWRV